MRKYLWGTKPNCENHHTCTKEQSWLEMQNPIVKEFQQRKSRKSNAEVRFLFALRMIISSSPWVGRIVLKKKEKRRTDVMLQLSLLDSCDNQGNIPTTPHWQMFVLLRPSRMFNKSVHCICVLPDSTEAKEFDPAKTVAVHVAFLNGIENCMMYATLEERFSEQWNKFNPRYINAWEWWFCFFWIVPILRTEETRIFLSDWLKSCLVWEKLGWSAVLWNVTLWWRLRPSVWYKSSRLFFF